MIRILHTADLHLGVETYGKLDPSTGLSTRIGDCLTALDQAVDAALDQQVDLFLFCGDAYKNREPSPTLQREFARRVGRLASNGVAVFLLVGNHDLPNALGRATTVEIFDTLAIRNIYVASRPGATLVQTRRGPLQVVALPWVTPSRLLSKEEHKGKTLQEINRLIEEKLGSILDMESSSVDPGIPAILAAHVLVSGARPSSESRMALMQARDALLMPSQVASSAFAYVALGHVHRHQVLNTLPPVVYAGSLQRLDFGEEKEEKGYVLVEIESRESRVESRESSENHFAATGNVEQGTLKGPECGLHNALDAPEDWGKQGGASTLDSRPSTLELGSTLDSRPSTLEVASTLDPGPWTLDPPYVASFRFVPVAARPFRTIEVDAEQEEDPTAAVLRALERLDFREAIVRLTVRLSAAGEGLLRETEIARALKEAHYASISREVKRDQRVRLGGRAAEELGPLEALALYLETKGADRERILLLQDYAKRLMGEDVPGMPLR